ncbi:MAG: type II toxin-antitoxin system RelE/ParE family toxin [Planctomycetes bacterium]|nr:type II toxin-antitoxin system RelE/ParE family toxin [Planctomycetota bacterium]
MAQATVDFHPDAVLEGAAANAWYTERSPVAAVALVTELDSAIEAIAEQPTRWPRYLHGTRRYLLRRFPYAVVYREKPGSVLVVAFAHCSRRPGYWKGR